MEKKLEALLQGHTLSLSVSPNSLSARHENSNVIFPWDNYSLIESFSGSRRRAIALEKELITGSFFAL